MGRIDRVYERITIHTKCVLEIDGRKFDCLAENISTTGAMLKLSKIDTNYLSIADRGTIKIFLESPLTYLCTVVRKDHEFVGVQFM
jgi:hypothetical protein